MKKDITLLKSQENLQAAFDVLDPNKYHILYFCYNLNFHNIYHFPLILTTSLVNFIRNIFSKEKLPQIHHVAQISRFPFDEDLKCVRPKIFEATTREGMVEHELFDRLMAMSGTVIVETVDIQVDKAAARLFEMRYKGIAYSELAAGNSVFNYKWLDKIVKRKSNGLFCSLLLVLSLEQQGINLVKILKKLAEKIIPRDVYLANLGKKSLFYKSC